MYSYEKMTEKTTEKCRESNTIQKGKNMFQRLFGNTPEEQLTYLQPRILLTVLIIVVGLLAMLFGGSGDWIIVIAAYVWGWNFLKNWFGFTTIGAFFSGNIAIGVVLFVGYLIIGYVIGLIMFLLGAVRYIQLRLLFKR